MNFNAQIKLVDYVCRLAKKKKKFLRNKKHHISIELLFFIGNLH